MISGCRSQPRDILVKGLRLALFNVFYPDADSLMLTDDAATKLPRSSAIPLADLTSSSGGELLGACPLLSKYYRSWCGCETPGSMRGTTGSSEPLWATSTTMIYCGSWLGFLRKVLTLRSSLVPQVGDPEQPLEFLHHHMPPQQGQRKCNEWANTDTGPLSSPPTKIPIVGLPHMTLPTLASSPSCSRSWTDICPPRTRSFRACVIYWHLRGLGRSYIPSREGRSQGSIGHRTFTLFGISPAQGAVELGTTILERLL